MRNRREHLPSLSLCLHVFALSSRLTRPYSRPWCSRNVGRGVQESRREETSEALKLSQLCRWLAALRRGGEVTAHRLAQMKTHVPKRGETLRARPTRRPMRRWRPYWRMRDRRATSPLALFKRARLHPCDPDEYKCCAIICKNISWKKKHIKQFIS